MQELFLTNALFQILESSPDAVFLKRTDGTIVTWNSAAERTYGYSQSETIGQSVYMLAPADRRDEVEEILNRIGDGKSVEQWETVRVAQDGSIIYVSLTAVPIRDGEGDIWGAAVFMRDISRRRALEERLRQAEKMEAVGRLAAGIAHDFNNLLTIINGYSELLVAEVDQSTQHYDFVRQLRTAGSRAATLTRQLLTFSRSNVLRKEAVDLNTIIVNFIPILKTLMRQDIEIVQALAPRIHCVYADPGQLEQILMNLAINAMDAMPGGGRMTIVTDIVELDSAESETHGVTPGIFVSLSIIDTGYGMSAETMEHVFEPFFTTKNVGEGTGLGLSTVFGIVKQHRGDIFVESAPGRGTRFQVLLPATEEPEHLAPARPTPANAQAPSTQRGVIVLVEDEQGIRTMIERALRQAGYSVIAFEDGIAALDGTTALTPSIELLITDIVMPRLGGLELAHRMRQKNPDLNVLFCSGYPATNTSLLQDSLLENCYLQKPFTIQQMLSKIQDILHMPHQ